MKKIILASKSPRRAELLSRMGYDFDAVDTGVDESKISAPSPVELVKLLAIAKAERAHELYGLSDGGKHIIIAADTVVDCGGRILGKPADGADAKRMLRGLSGTRHFVHTGLCVTSGGKAVFADTISAAVWFRRIDDAEIDAYVATRRTY